MKKHNNPKNVKLTLKKCIEPYIKFKIIQQRFIKKY